MEKTESNLNGVTADLGKFISLKEFSSSNPCSFSARKKHKKAQDETKHEKKKLLKALIRYLCLINIPILPQVKKVEKKKSVATGVLICQG